MDPADPVTRSVELLRRARAGERSALNRLFERYYGRLRRIVRVRLGPALRRQVDSAEILQETFAAAVKDLERFEIREEASLIHWLGRIAHHRILEAARRAERGVGRERLHDPPETDRPGRRDAVPDTSPTPSEAAAHREEAARLERCLDGLPEAERELILLRDYAGASWQLVAEATGRPSADAARMAHSRAMAALTAAMVRDA